MIERSARLSNEARVGRVEEVIVEGPSKKDPAVVSGRTRQNKLIHFAPGQPMRPGTVALVRVETAAVHHLAGSLVEVVVPPRHRTRIPVTLG